MRELQENRKWRRLVYSKFSIVLLLIVAAFLANSVWNVYQKNRITAYYREQSESQLAELQTERDRLMAEVARLETVRGREEEIRRNFSVVGEGERVIIVLDPDEPEAPEIKVEEKTGWRAKFDQVLDLFRNKRD
ncbi:MAG: hypothetical protein WDZ85_02885 [Candidatus Paceibacterota bacterium]